MNPASEPSPQKDEFGRDKKASSPSQPSIKPRRYIIDADTKLSIDNSLSPDESKIAMKITRLIVTLCNSSERPGTTRIEELSKTLFNDFQAHDNLIKTLFIDAITRLSPQVEVVAALIAHYCTKYSQILLSTFLSTDLPEAIKAAVLSDKYTSLKLILRALGAFVAYNLITPASFAKTLSDIADLLPTASPCRAEAISHAILVASLIAPASVTEELLNPINEKIRASVAKRPPKFIRLFSPIEDCDLSIVDQLLRSDHFPSLTAQYEEMFKLQTPVTFPELHLEFSPNDLSPFPLVLSNTEKTATDNKPVLADIFYDVLIFFGDDTQLVSQQLFAVPMLLGLRSLNCQDPVISQYSTILPILFIAILSDLFRIPSSIHQAAFHVSILYQLFFIYERDIPYYFTIEVISIVNQLSRLDIGCYHRLINAFCHQISFWDFSWCWDRWENLTLLPSVDMRNIFIRNVCAELQSYGPTAVIKRSLPQSFHRLIPEIGVEVFPFSTESGLTPLAEKLDEVIRTNPDSLENSYKELAGRVQEFAALKILITCMFYGSNGSCEVVFLQLEKFEKLLLNLFHEDWKSKLIIQSAAIYFRDQPTVLRQIILYLINRGYAELKVFIEWFFDPVEVENLSEPLLWNVFRDVLNGIMTKYRAAQNEEKLKAVIVDVFTEALALCSKHELGSISDRLFYGNLRDFGRVNYDTFKDAYDQIKGTISENPAEKKFKDMVDGVYQIANQ